MFSNDLLSVWRKLSPDQFWKDLNMQSALFEPKYADYVPYQLVMIVGKAHLAPWNAALPDDLAVFQPIEYKINYPKFMHSFAILWA